MGVVAIYAPDVREINKFFPETSTGVAFSTTQARTGTYSLRMNSALWPININVAVRADYYIRCGVYITNYHSEALRIQFKDSSLTKHISIVFNTTAQQIEARRGDQNGTILGTGSLTLNMNQWYCVEIYAKVDDSTGAITVKVDGTADITLTSQDTRNGGTAEIGRVTWEVAGNYSYIDDIIIRDDDWPGQGSVYLLQVDGEGDETDWTASAGNPEDCVDEVPWSDSDYVYADSATPNLKQDFTMEDLPDTYTSIDAVQVLAIVGLSAAGSGDAKVYCDSNGTEEDGSSTALDVTPVGLRHIMSLNPDDSAAWEKADVNAIKVGVETL